MEGSRCISAFLLIACFCYCTATFFPDYDDASILFPERTERIRRFIRVISKKPDPDAEPETGIGFKGHMKNLLRGGTLHFKMRIPYMEEMGKHVPFSKEDNMKEMKKDFEMLEREGRVSDYGHLINPRVRKEEP